MKLKLFCNYGDTVSITMDTNVITSKLWKVYYNHNQIIFITKLEMLPLMITLHFCFYNLVVSIITFEVWLILISLLLYNNLQSSYPP